MSILKTMKRIQLKDFTFLVKPAHYARDWKHAEVTTAMEAELPNAPLLVAIGDEPLHFQVRLSIPPSGYVGLCAYHLDSVFASVGVNAHSLRAFTMMRSVPSNITLPFTSTSTYLIWHLEWDTGAVRIGYQANEESEIQWVGSFELPGTTKSVSFGAFFASSGEAYRATIEHVRVQALY